MKFSITHILDGVFLHLCSGSIEGLKRLLETVLPCYIFKAVKTKVSHAVGESIYSSHTTTSIYNQRLVGSGRISLSHLIGWGSCICTVLRELAVGLIERFQLFFCFLLFFFSHSGERKHFTKSIHKTCKHMQINNDSFSVNASPSVDMTYLSLCLVSNSWVVRIASPICSFSVTISSSDIYNKT